MIPVRQWCRAGAGVREASHAQAGPRPVGWRGGGSGTVALDGVRIALRLEGKGLVRATR
jgi:hypothetical protein